MGFKFRNTQGQLRDGWKCTAFLVASMACFVVVGVVGHALPPAIKAFAPGAILITLLGMLLTYAAVRMEGTSLASVGLALNRQFLLQFGLGTLGGGLMIAVSAWLVCSFAGVNLAPAAPPAWPLELKMLAVFLGGAIFEELQFRGYAFQRAVRGMGMWPALCLFGVLFCLGHLPGNLDVATPLLVVAMANLLLDCVTQSLILYRSGSLALPIGLHFGWNYVQDALGFGVSGISHTSGWFKADLGTQAGWLTGGEFGLEASVFALGVQGVLLVWLLWTAPRTTPRSLRSEAQLVAA